MRKRGIHVIDLDDFMCRCGHREFDREEQNGAATGLTCRVCKLHYSVKKKEKRIRMTNLPMSFGFRSLYWDKIETTGKGIYGISEQGYEIHEEE